VWEDDMQNIRSILTATAFAAVFAAAWAPAQAQSGYIINGRPALDREAQILWSNGVPPGAYWVDARGNIAPAEPGYNRRTTGGDIMSDGKCAFVAGVPVGNCN
jgi:hypothetical protein